MFLTGRWGSRTIGLLGAGRGIGGGLRVEEPEVVGRAGMGLTMDRRAAMLRTGSNAESLLLLLFARRQQCNSYPSLQRVSSIDEK